MTCESLKQDSNITGLSIAEEECLKQLPATPVWVAMEPNSYSDFGGEISSVARAPIDPSRQNKKGTITDMDASGGFNIDFTQNNLYSLLQGFMFADARERATTKPLNGAAVPIASVSAPDNEYVLGSSIAAFKAGSILVAKGFGVATNNGKKVVSGVTGTNVEVAPALAAEASVPPTAELKLVGHKFQLGETELAIVAGVVTLTNTITDFAGLDGLYAGAWIFVGGDAVDAAFANNVGYARVRSVTGKVLVLDDITWTPANEAGTTKELEIYVGDMIRNEFEPALIKRRSYQLERTLGQDEDGPQAEYLEGAVANEFTLNVTQADKITADLSYIACDNTQRSGAEGPKAGTRVMAAGEDAFNTSQNVYRIKLSELKTETSTPASLFGYLSEATVTINNNVSPNKAIGVLGAFDTSAGNFEVGGSITAYFTTTAAVQAVRNNADVGLNVIAAARNAGFVFDIPLMGLGGGRVNVEKDQPITVPVEPAGAQSKFGYTLAYVRFSYLPSVAMP